MHLDQGIAVTSHASQGKTVDQVIASVPVNSFAQANEAQFYVSMSRARQAMHVFTDSKAALREAVMRASTPHCHYSIFSSFAALHLPFNSLPAFAPVGIEATPGDCFPKFRLVPWHPCLTHPIHATLKLGKST